MLGSVGVPVRMPVALLKVRVLGNTPPASWNVGAGAPVAVTVKVLGAPTKNVTPLALVIEGGTVATDARKLATVSRVLSSASFAFAVAATPVVFPPKLTFGFEK